MAVAGNVVETFHDGAPNAPLILFTSQLMFDPRDMRALIQDFFFWFEEEWKQPVVQIRSLKDRNELFDRLFAIPYIETNRAYTFVDLGALWEHSPKKVANDIRKWGVCACGQLARSMNGGSGKNLYLGRDLANVIGAWKWERLCEGVDAFWAHFLQEPCGRCIPCRAAPNKAAFHCSMNKHHEITLYRESFFRLLQALRRYGDVESWWHQEQGIVFERKPGAINQQSGIALLYLLDRHLLDLSFDDILRLPLADMTYSDALRPWCHRHPGEYDSVLLGLQTAKYVTKIQQQALGLLAIMVLLKYGFPGVAELGRRLTREEVQHVVQEGRLLTLYVGYDVFLNAPVSDDIRVGHVVLDDILKYFWKYSATRVQEHAQQRWDYGPRDWRPLHIRALERAFTAKIWSGGQPLLPMRLETEKMQHNPFYRRQRAEQEGYALHLFPANIQQAIPIYVNYRYWEQRIALKTLSVDLNAVLLFLSWAREHCDLNQYTSWDQQMVRDLVLAFLSDKYASRQEGKHNRYTNLSKLYIFFETLAKMNLPYPPGYQVIPSLLPPYPEVSYVLPVEDVLDRVFSEGVCQLDYDPFARLALTIQYYCGTRVTETCDLPLFCIWEAPNADYAYLVIPRGKTKQERMFPIVSVGMGPLLEYMDQVVMMQLQPDGKPRHFSRMNGRYLETDAKRAYDWDYLFDRGLHGTNSSGTHLRVLTPQRVYEALQEALLLTAKRNPQGLFREETYSRSCRRQRYKGQECGYIALDDGVIICPVCEGPLPGRRMRRCHHKLARDIICEGVVPEGVERAYFCPKCNAPLADMLSITTHTFRHNSVTRAHRHGVALAQNMRLHGHQTVPMHLRYLHLLPEDQHAAVYHIFSEKLLRDMRLESPYVPGQMIQDGVAHTVTTEQVLALTLQRGLMRRTYGFWGGFWTGVLAEEGMISPVRLKAEMIITEETYHYMVAQYRYEALGLAVSEVALELGTKGKFKAIIAPFLQCEEIERIVASYLEHVQQGYLNTARGVRLIEADIQKQRAFMNELAEMLYPWWQHLGSIDQLVTELFSDIDIFQKPRECDAIIQE